MIQTIFLSITFYFFHDAEEKKVYSFVSTLKIFDVVKAAALLSFSGGALTLNKKVILDNAGFHLYKRDKLRVVWFENAFRIVSLYVGEHGT